MKLPKFFTTTAQTVKNFVLLVGLYLNRSYGSVRHFARMKYIGAVEAITLFALARSSSLVRKTLILKGYNPDYVPPKPEVKEEISPNRRLVPAWPTNSIASGDIWVSKPAEHRILKTRKQFEEHQENFKNSHPIEDDAALLVSLFDSEKKY